MKRLLIVIALASSLFTGCGIFPKRVEFFQEKIQRFPVPKAAEREVQRQAAQRAAETAEEVLRAALLDGSTPAVTEPADETAKLTDAVSRSLGPPVSPSILPSDELSRKLDKALAKLNQRLDGFREESDKNVGKKVEGTGVFSVPYFAWVGGLAIVGFLIWTVLRAFVNVAAAGNPAVAVGLTAVRAGGRLASAAVGQLVTGGEKFLGKLKSEAPELSDDLRKKVEDLFRNAHKESQDAAVRDVVDKLVKKG